MIGEIYSGELFFQTVRIDTFFKIVTAFFFVFALIVLLCMLICSDSTLLSLSVLIVNDTTVLL